MPAPNQPVPTPEKENVKPKKEKPYNLDPNGNEITKRGKIIAGFTLVIIMIAAIVTIIAHWPDKMPPTDAGTETKYQYKWFGMTYLGKNGLRDDSVTIKLPGNIFRKDTLKHVGSLDTTQVITVNTDSPGKSSADTLVRVSITTSKSKNICTIDLNTLLLLLVAISGFLGNMIHISASFTNFVGAGTFRKSWLLWYWVKPFTASALAVGVYIIFRAGFLNSTEATASVNLYGIVAISLLSGLFTDMATQKLKEVFGVIFQTTTVRPNPLDAPSIKITGVRPSVSTLNVETELVVLGVGFVKTLKVVIDGEEIADVDIEPTSITFKYTPKTIKPILSITDEKGAEIIKYELKATAPEDQNTTTAEPTVTDINPTNTTVNTSTPINITGTGLDAAGLVVKVGDLVIDDASLVKTATSITLNETPTVAGALVVSVTDDKGNELKSQTITVA